MPDHGLWAHSRRGPENPGRTARALCVVSVSQNVAAHCRATAGRGDPHASGLKVYCDEARRCIERGSSRVAAFTGQLGDVSLDTTNGYAEICRFAWRQSATHASSPRKRKACIGLLSPLAASERFHSQAADHGHDSRVSAQADESRAHLQKVQRHGTLLISLFQPFHRTALITQPAINDSQIERRDIALL